MNILITPAQIIHSSAITSLTQELGYSATESQTKEWLDYLLNSDNHRVIVASNEAKDICGWLVVEKRISLEAGFKAEITGLVVGQKFRRFGVGKKLVLEAVNWANELKLQRILVRSNIQREESHVFYQQMGFLFKKSAHNYELRLPT